MIHLLYVEGDRCRSFTYIRIRFAIDLYFRIRLHSIYYHLNQAFFFLLKEVHANAVQYIYCRCKSDGSGDIGCPGFFTIREEIFNFVAIHINILNHSATHFLWFDFTQDVFSCNDDTRRTRDVRFMTGEDKSIYILSRIIGNRHMNRHMCQHLSSIHQHECSVFMS